MPERVRVYVDGFNFYYAIKNEHELDPRQFPLGLGWCDFEKLTRQYMLKPGEHLNGIKYFTARVSRDQANKIGEESRQQTWLDAVSSIDGVQVFSGFHQKPRKRNGKSKEREEKQTDINIAVELLIDALNNQCDRAILITGDIDQAPAAYAARERLPLERRVEVDVWVPPGITHHRWDAYAAKWGMTCKEITSDMLARSRLDDVVTSKNGARIKCLDEWKMPTGIEGLRWRV